MRSVIILIAAAAPACGGTLSIGSTDAGQEASTEAGAPDAGDRCAPDGVRICAPEDGCPDLTGSSCPGVGCMGLNAVDGGATSDGVCWSDLQDLGDVSCAACNDGQSCIGRGVELRCVPNDVCRAFWDLGIRDVCTYADKHAYDGRALPPEPASCPIPAGEGYLCGGACGACRNDEAQRCVGRSPDHPTGVCVWLPAVADPHDPSTIPTCALSATGYAVACPPSPAGLVCGVFGATGPADTARSKQYGLCMPSDMCRTIANALPGGFGCYSSEGILVAGR
jgi:hypothetical protein